MKGDMDKSNMDVLVSKKILNTEMCHLDDKTVGTYIALRTLYDSTSDKTYVSYNQLAAILTGDKWKRATKETIPYGINQLSNDNKISIVDQISTTEYFLNLQNLSLNRTKEIFTVLSLNDIHKIFQSNNRVDKFSLLRYFGNLIGSINSQSFTVLKGVKKDNFVGFMPISYLAKISGISEKTAKAYNMILQDEKLIYVYKHDKFSLDSTTGAIKTYHNHYGRYKDRDYIADFAVKLEDKEESESVWGESNIMDQETDYKKAAMKVEYVNKQRSMKQKYNALLNGSEYSEDELKELLDYYNQYNSRVQKEAGRHKDTRTETDILQKLIDINVIENALDKYSAW